eukprot:CAMPEP_0170967216 /NCGR_PEP_ID=MMETSP0735-20130129/42371_1 /TAXON_ID=186038 /ORGANISM="Fragilariopsis kerguelensis, Strain L26-C5" /LENGTH=56 /DNA_ID=CAMNT_0011385693 /DNA_START=49 /DNA_END=215 /DNA_ORIENTATION=-
MVFHKYLTARGVIIDDSSSSDCGVDSDVDVAVDDDIDDDGVDTNRRRYNRTPSSVV